MRIAFKEWAIVADALATGRQIIILRKGGISEGRGGFQLEHPEFLLFPTLFHQQRESVLPDAQTRYDQIQNRFAPPDILRVEYFCRVEAWHQLNDLASAQHLQGQHIWRPEVIAERFDWGRQKTIFALAVRTFKLSALADLPMLPTYGGCKSWVELDRDFDPANAIPALPDDIFAKKLEAFRKSLQ